MMNALHNGLVAVVLWQVKVRAPPGVWQAGIRPAVVCVQKRAQVRAVRRAGRTKIVERAGAAFHFIEVAVGQIVLLQKPAVLLFDSQIHAPEIAFELRAGTRFVRVINHAKGHEGGVRRRHAGQLKQTEAERLKHALLTAMVVIALLNARAEIHLRPGCFELLPPIVAWLKVMSAVHVELPHILNHRVAPDAAARAEVDVIIDLAVVHERSKPGISVAGVTAEPRRRGDRVALADQVINGQSAHDVAGVVDHHSICPGGPRLHRTVPSRHAIINEIREIRLWVIRVGHA